MILVPLPASAIDRLWPAVRPFAEQMAEAMPDDWPVPEIRRRAAARTLTLWAVWSPRERDLAALVGTEIQLRPSGRKALSIAMTAGHDPRDWIHLLPQLERYAAACGCVFVEIRGRSGWSRLLTEYRAKPGVVLTKELPDG